MKEISFQLKEDFIPLIQLLKYTGVADSGAHASIMVQSGDVLSNGHLETRKRYKVVKGDTIQVDQTIIKII